MKRFLLAAAFFAALVLLWEAAYRARIWSPVLLPSPRQVVTYLESAAADGTLAKATVITMRRLLIGYFIGLVVGLPLGLLTAPQAGHPEGSCAPHSAQNLRPASFWVEQFGQITGPSYGATAAMRRA